MKDKEYLRSQYILACKAINPLEKKQHQTRLALKKAMEIKARCKKQISKLQNRFTKENSLDPIELNKKIDRELAKLKNFSDTVSDLRGQLRRNRSGKDGLRHLNTIIRKYYNG